MFLKHPSEKSCLDEIAALEGSIVIFAHLFIQQNFVGPCSAPDSERAEHIMKAGTQSCL